MTAPNSPARTRSKRICAYWGLAFTFLLILGVFCWRVALPVIEVRAALAGCKRPWYEGDHVVEQLGGPEGALPKLRLYLRMPERISGYKAGALYVMPRCGEPGRLTLVRTLLNDRDPGMRSTAAASLGYCQDAGPRITGALERAAQDSDAKVRRVAAEALEQIRQTQEMLKAIRAAEATERKPKP